jgi:hypothetical protein
MLEKGRGFGRRLTKEGGMMGARVLSVVLAAALLAAAACEGVNDSSGSGDADTDADSDSDADADSDSDADADSDSDADGDGGADDCYDAIDVVFVLDVSTSMGPMLQALEEDIAEVWAAADALTELDEATHFGLVVFVDDYLVANGGETFTDVTTLQTRFNQWYTHTSSNEQTQSTASNTDWPENSLDALYAAAADYNWRDPDTTLRVVIHATDDTFLEAPASFASGIAVQHDYADTVAALQAGTIRVMSFAAHLGGPLGDADVEPGFFTDYAGQSAIPAATSGAAYEIADVGGTLSLAAAINEFVAEEFCEDYVVE